MRTPLLVLSLIILGSAALLAACGGGDDDASSNSPAPNPGQVTITAKDFGFDKTSLAGKAGQSIHVIFKNEGHTAHSFTIDTVVDTEAEGGESSAADFTAPLQTVQFYCKYHPTQMKGTLSIS